MRKFDAIYLAGSHGAMYDFLENTDLQAIIAMHYEARKIVSAACHGVGGLLNVRISNGKNLIADKKLQDLVGWKNFCTTQKIGAIQSRASVKKSWRAL